MSWTGLKKNLDLAVEYRRRIIDPSNRRLTISRQCELTGLARSSYYYEPAGESEYNENLMKLIDELYTEHPALGSRKIAEILRAMGWEANRKRVRRLMQVMGIACESVR